VAARTMLEVKEPFIRGYVHHAFRMSVVSLYESYEDWFFNYFIQLRIPYKDSSHGENKIDFINDYYLHNSRKIYSPILMEQLVSKSIIQHYKSGIIEFLIDCIEDNWYIELTLDEYFVPHRPTYRSEHYDHSNLIYGVDRDNQCFYLLGYDDRKTFAKTQISFGQFVEAYSNTTVSEWTFNYFISLFKLRERPISKFEWSTVYYSLIDYLNGKPHNYSTPNDVYGIHVYQTLLEYLQLYVSGETKHDIRGFHVLWEHKKCMVERIRYMKQKQYLTDIDDLLQKWITIENNTQVIRNKFLKLGLYEKKADVQSGVQSITEQVNVIVDLEREALNQFIKLMSGKMERNDHA
jgi:hypothetical protein